MSDIFGNKSNCIHPDTQKPYFQQLLNVNKGFGKHIETEQKLMTLEDSMQRKIGLVDSAIKVDEIILGIK